jgi:hypothetical protein
MAKKKYKKYYTKKQADSLNRLGNSYTVSMTPEMLNKFNGQQTSMGNNIPIDFAYSYYPELARYDSAVGFQPSSFSMGRYGFGRNPNGTVNINNIATYFNPNYENIVEANRNKNINTLTPKTINTIPTISNPNIAVPNVDNIKPNIIERYKRSYDKDKGFGYTQTDESNGNILEQQWISPKQYFNKHITKPNYGGSNFKKGGRIDFPGVKYANPYLVPEYNQPMVGNVILPDPNRPGLFGTNATEYKQDNDFDGRSVQIPRVVSGQLLSPEGAVQRYLLTGERFKTMDNPAAYSKFYDTISKLGMMGKFALGGDPTKKKPVNIQLKPNPISAGTTYVEHVKPYNNKYFNYAAGTVSNTLDQANRIIAYPFNVLGSMVGLNKVPPVSDLAIPKDTYQQRVNTGDLDGNQVIEAGINAAMFGTPGKMVGEGISEYGGKLLDYASPRVAAYSKEYILPPIKKGYNAIQKVVKDPAIVKDAVKVGAPIAKDVVNTLGLARKYNKITDRKYDLQRLDLDVPSRNGKYGIIPKYKPTINYKNELVDNYNKVAKLRENLGLKESIGMSKQYGRDMLSMYSSPTLNEAFNNKSYTSGLSIDYKERLIRLKNNADWVKGLTSNNNVIYDNSKTGLLGNTKLEGDYFNLKNSKNTNYSLSPMYGTTTYKLNNGKLEVNTLKGSNVPEYSNYLKDVKDNREFVESKIPGLKIIGSGRVSDAINRPGISGDVDGIIGVNDYRKLKDIKLSYNQSTKYGNTLKIHPENNKMADVDVNIIHKDESGNAAGELAEKYYKYHNPTDFYKQTMAIIEGKQRKFKIPMTPEELVDKTDPVVTTMVDAMYAKSNPKNILKYDLDINYSNPDKVLEAQKIYVNSLVGEGNVGKQFTTEELSDVTKNKEILNKIDFIGDLDRVANDPKRMQAALNDYYINNTVLARGIHLSTPKANIRKGFTSSTRPGNPDVGGRAQGIGINTMQHEGTYKGISGQYQLDLGINKASTIDEYINTIDRKTSGHTPITDSQKAKILEIANKQNLDIENELKDVTNANELFNIKSLKENEHFDDQAFTSEVAKVLDKRYYKGLHKDDRFVAIIDNIDKELDKLVYGNEKYFEELKSKSLRNETIKDLKNLSTNITDKESFYRAKNAIDTNIEKVQTIIDRLKESRIEHINKLQSIRANRGYKGKNPDKIKLQELYNEHDKIINNVKADIEKYRKLESELQDRADAILPVLKAFKKGGIHAIEGLSVVVGAKIVKAIGDPDSKYAKWKANNKKRHERIRQEHKVYNQYKQRQDILKQKQHSNYNDKEY